MGPSVGPPGHDTGVTLRSPRLVVGPLSVVQVVEGGPVRTLLGVPAGEWGLESRGLETYDRRGVPRS